MATATGIESIESAERRAKRFWIALVVFLFVIQSTIMGLVMHLAIGDPSAAVVPDYHNRALNWDEARRTLEAADRLGWTVTFDASDVADDRGMRAIELNITDEQGDGINGLVVGGKLYHHARADEVSPVALKSIGEGNYLALVPAGRPGIWQLELKIEGASEPVAQSLTFNIER
ncbi:FixH family protein [Rhodopirellula sp. JC639]|uniref:FixH family protein n=1 Tax=Stieleria mannarensis TaxID=2755585 RepID=UPI001603F628|nr:FixH family protein [Rhodopirellula sp. JC639]